MTATHRPPSRSTTSAKQIAATLCCIICLSALSVTAALSPGTPVTVSVPRPNLRARLSFATTSATNVIVTPATVHYSMIQSHVGLDVIEYPDSIATTASSLAFASLCRGEVDAIFTTLIATDAQKAAQPDIAHYPIFAFGYGPTYNLPAVSKPMVFSVPLLAKIYAGNITRWNDPRIAALNPSVILPNQDIIMVIQQESVPFLQLFTRALRNVDAELASLVAESSGPAWPLHRYAQHVLVGGRQEVPSYVAANKYTLAVCLQLFINQISSTMGYMMNHDGVVMKPSFLGVHAAFSSQSLTSKYADTTDGIAYTPTDGVTNAPGTAAWPFVVEGTLSVPRTYSRLTCVQRAELVKFLMFVMNSEAINYQIAADRFAAVLTNALDTAVGLGNFLSTGMFCNGYKVNIPQRNNAMLGFSSPSSIHPSSRVLLLDIYDSKDNYVAYQYINTNEMDQISNLLAGPTHINGQLMQLNSAWIMPFTFHYQYPGVLEQQRDAGLLSFFPSGLFAIWPFFRLHPDITAAMSVMDAFPLKIDEETLGKLYTGQIQSWLDQDFLSFNPKLADAYAANPHVSSAISLILYGKGDKATTHLAGLSNHYVFHLNRTDAFQNSGMTWSLPADWTQLTNKLDSIGMKYYYMNQELDMENFVEHIDGGIGYIMGTNNVPDITTVFSIVRYYQPQGAATKIPLVIRPHTDSYKSCADRAPIPDGDRPLAAVSFDSLMYVPDNAADAYCWPFMVLTELIVKTSVHDGTQAESLDDLVTANSSSVSTTNNVITAQNANFCFFHKGIVKFLNWLMTEKTTFAPSNMMARQAFVQSDKYQPYYQDELNTLKCGGQYLLFTPAFAWILSYNVKAFSFAVSSISLVAMLVAAVVLYRHRNRTIIRASGWLMQTLNITGTLLLLISSIMLVQTHTDSLCSGLSWTLVLGLTLTISPQMLKIYRIYYTVVRHESRHHEHVSLKQKGFGAKQIYMTIAALLMIDLALLITVESWTSGLLHPETTVIFANEEEHDYVSCASKGNAISFTIVLFGIKALMIFYGSYCAFRVRHVASAFGESTKISWSLWSMTVAAIIIVPLIVLTGSDYGDLYIFLVLFLILWISCGSMAFVVGYKLLAISSEAWRVFKQQQHTSSVGHSSLHQSAAHGSAVVASLLKTSSVTTDGITSTTTGSGYTFSFFGSSGATTTKNSNYIFPEIPHHVSLHRLEKYIDSLEYQLLKAKERMLKEGKAPINSSNTSGGGLLKSITNRFHPHNSQHTDSNAKKFTSAAVHIPPAHISPPAGPAAAAAAAAVRSSSPSTLSRRFGPVSPNFHIEVSKAEVSSKYAVQQHDPPSRSDQNLSELHIHNSEFSHRDHSHLPVPIASPNSSTRHIEEHGSLGELQQRHLAHHSVKHSYQPLHITGGSSGSSSGKTSPEPRPTFIRHGSHNGVLSHTPPLATRPLPPRVHRAVTSSHSVEFMNHSLFSAAGHKVTLSLPLETIHSPDATPVKAPVNRNDNSHTILLAAPSFNIP